MSRPPRHFTPGLFFTAAAAAAGTSSSAVRPPQEEPSIASWQKLSRVYPASRISPNSYRRLCRNADLGFTSELQEFYDEVAEDDFVGSKLRTMKSAIASAPFSVEPGDETPAGKEISDEAEAMFKRMPGFGQLRNDLADARYRGFSSLFPVYESRFINRRASWDIVSHKVIESRFFKFEGDRPLLMTQDNPSGEPLDDLGLVFYVWRDKAGTPQRSGVGRGMGRSFVYRGFTGIDGQGFIEKYSSPFAYAELPLNIKEGTPEFQRVVDALRSLMVDQVGIVSPGVQLKLLESMQKSATVKDVFLAWIKWHEGNITQAALGVEATTEMGPGGLGHGGEATQQGEVAQDLKDDLASGVSAVINEQLLDPWTAYNYGAGAPRPRLCIQVGKPEDKKTKAEAQKTRAETLNIVGKVIKTFSTAQLRKDFDAVAPADAADTVEWPSSPAPPPAAPSGVDAPVLNRLGACPHCSGEFTLGAAEKKKRSLLSAPSRS